MKTPNDNDALARCLACRKPFRPDDLYLADVSGGFVHFLCVGDDPESFVDLGTGKPLGRKPRPSVWGIS